jgi:hypothetical protein
MNFFRIPDPEGMFLGEIFVRILVLLCTVGSSAFYPQDPGSGSGMKNFGIRIRDKTSRIRNTVRHQTIFDKPTIAKVVRNNSTSKTNISILFLIQDLKKHVNLG